MSNLSRSLLLLTLISAGTAYSSSGVAQPPGPPPQAPARMSVDGKFAHYLVSPKGDIDGLVLEDATVARFPPHAIASDTTMLRPGDAVRVEGDAVNGPTGRALVRASVSKGNVVIVRADIPPPPPSGGPGAGARPHRGGKHGPKDGKGPHEDSLLSMTVTGKIQGFSTDPHGIVDGILFVDGTSARAGKKARIETLGLKAGDTITVTGKGGNYPQGSSLEIETVKLPSGEVRTVERLRVDLTPVSHEGEVARVLLNPHGDVDGLLLKDSTFIRIRPTVSNPQLAAGSRVRAEGDGTASFVRADKLTLTATGAVLDPATPPPGRPAPRALKTIEDSSSVLELVNNPEGEIEILVLQDGALVTLPPKLREEAEDAIKVGTKLTVSGEGGTYGAVKALRADRVPLASGQVFYEPKRPEAPPKPSNRAR